MVIILWLVDMGVQGSHPGQNDELFMEMRSVFQMLQPPVLIEE